MKKKKPIVSWFSDDAELGRKTTIRSPATAIGRGLKPLAKLNLTGAENKKNHEEKKLKRNIKHSSRLNFTFLSSFFNNTFLSLFSFSLLIKLNEIIF
jgi:hypothetical protein